MQGRRSGMNERQRIMLVDGDLAMAGVLNRTLQLLGEGDAKDRR